MTLEKLSLRLSAFIARMFSVRRKTAASISVECATNERKLWKKFKNTVFSCTCVEKERDMGMMGPYHNSQKYTVDDKPLPLPVLGWEWSNKGSFASVSEDGKICVSGHSTKCANRVASKRFTSCGNDEIQTTKVMTRKYPHQKSLRTPPSIVLKNPKGYEMQHWSLLEKGRLRYKRLVASDRIIVSGTVSWVISELPITKTQVMKDTNVAYGNKKTKQTHGISDV